jgi:hypothetical protein
MRHIFILARYWLGNSLRNSWVVSGRCLLEVLKTGVIMPKTRYSLVFTASNEPADQMVGPCEIPTLVEAQPVLSAWQRVRTVMACEEMAAQEISARYCLPIVQAAKAHFARRVPVASPPHDWYTPLYAQIYPLIATRYYCPIGMDPMCFAAQVRGVTRPPSPASGCDPCEFCQQHLRPCGVYYVGDGANAIDGARGLRLDQEGGEELVCVQSSGEEQKLDDLPACSPTQVAAHKQTNERVGGTLHAGEPALVSTWEGDGKSAEMSLKDVARQRSHFMEEDWEAYESAVAVEGCKQIQQERMVYVGKEAERPKISIIYLNELLTGRLDVVRQREGTSTVDGTLAVLLDGYEWLHRGGAIPLVQPPAESATAMWRVVSCPRPYAIRQETEARLVAIDQAKAIQGLEKVVERVLDTYEWLLRGGLAKKLFECLPPDSRGVWMKVDAQLKACLEEIGEEEDSCPDETLVILIWSYDWLYRSGLFEQIKELASTALSWFDLSEDDHETVEEVMKREESNDRFGTIQQLYLQHVRRHQEPRK